MTLQSIARTIAKARHGTDAMWANYMGAAEAVVREWIDALDSVPPIEGGRSSYHLSADWLRALIAQPDGAQ